MQRLFDRLTGGRGYAPYPFQEKVADTILKGKNLFLCAPTGSGKTWAALLPFLSARQTGQLLADRLIYVLPLRALATSLYKETIKACSNVFKVKLQPEDRTREKDEIVITIQTGEQKNDPFFEGDIIFTTVDQCLSSYLNMPVSLPGRVGNINGGALLGSLVVLDEFHLLDPDKSMKTAMEMLSRLRPFANFIIMTATLAAKSMDMMQEILGGEIIRLSDEEVLALPSHSEKRRAYRWIDKPICTDDIVRSHNHGRTIVIVNTVDRAQQLYLTLRQEFRKKDKGAEVLLLHSRFYPADRKKTEDVLMDWFGKDARNTNAVLITTQVIEAGMDISADNLHTELAPLNSIIQRAGRCARYAGARGTGTVWIYELEQDENGRSRLGPYRDQSEVINDTRKALAKLNPAGEILGFYAELDLIDRVHTEQESAYLARYDQDLFSLKQKILAAMDGRNQTAVRELIRDVASVNVIISDQPEMLRFDREKWPQMLPVPRSSLYKLKSYLSGGIIDDTRVAAIPDETGDESDLRFTWSWPTDIDQLVKASWLVVIHPDYAGYSAELGLQLGVPGASREPGYFQRPLIPRYTIRYETYGEHVRRVMDAAREMQGFNRCASEKLAACYDLDSGRIEKLVEIACALHDVGKLSVKWQNGIREWQEYKDPAKLTHEPLAHSDYDPEKDWREKQPSRGNHAVESGYAVSQWLFDNLDNEMVAAVIYTAIARHHGAFSKSLSDFQLIDDAATWAGLENPPFIQGKISLLDRPQPTDRLEFADDYLLNFERDEEWWPLYAFIVRRLRLADQKSQKGDARYED
ncbi:MAG TPA: CRISPR-associated helicase Cas3' [Desulfobacterales bacterium]|nr:CRISPR-associated helicase Cas3' [Desulfobacterales bacterium]